MDQKYLDNMRIKKFNDIESKLDRLKKLYTNNGFTQQDIKDMYDDGYFKNVEWVDDETLKIYRSLSLPESEVNDLTKGEIGVYWSFDKDIKPIWGNNMDYYEGDEKIVDIRCVGHLKLDDIDFKDCLYAMNDDYHNFTDEQEIRGKNGGNSIKVIMCKKIK